MNPFLLAYIVGAVVVLVTQAESEESTRGTWIALTVAVTWPFWIALRLVGLF